MLLCVQPPPPPGTDTDKTWARTHTFSRGRGPDRLLCAAGVPHVRPPLSLPPCHCLPAALALPAACQGSAAAVAASCMLTPPPQLFLHARCPTTKAAAGLPACNEALRQAAARRSSMSGSPTQRQPEALMAGAHARPWHLGAGGGRAPLPSHVAARVGAVVRPAAGGGRRVAAAPAVGAGAAAVVAVVRGRVGAAAVAAAAAAVVAAGAGAVRLRVGVGPVVGVPRVRVRTSVVAPATMRQSMGGGEETGRRGSGHDGAPGLSVARGMCGLGGP
jgi:hypothetical protein